MRLVSYCTDGRQSSWGAVVDGRVADLGAGRPELGWPTLASALAAAGVDGVRAAVDNLGADADGPAVDGLEHLPVVPDPGKVLCVGLNFEKHRIETGRERTEFPAVFIRFADSLVGHGVPIVRPAASTDFDFEGELALVIGRGGRRIAPADALSHVAGLTCFNDGSIRDFQRHTHQFAPGKNFPASGSVGPALVTLDELPDIGELELTTRLNGEVVQHAPISDLTYSVPEIIAYCSTWTELRPGDIIATGTPGGIGARRTPPLWMRPGDVCEVEVPGVGLLSNRVEAEV